MTDQSAPRPAPADTRIAFIGGGNMARSLIGGLIGRGWSPDRLRVGEPVAALREGLTRDFGVVAVADNDQAVADADTWLFAVKPQALAAVCADLRDSAQRDRPLIVSIAAGIGSEQISRWLGGEAAVVRAMPNTPALIGAGMTGLYGNERVGPDRRQRAEALMATVGDTVWVPEESLMDVVTAVSGSGPAYFFLLAEALQEAGRELGLAPDSARALSERTALGAARMLVESGESATTLRQRVTSPGGTTEAALTVLRDGGLPGLIARAVAAATRRGGELAARAEPAAANGKPEADG